MGNSAIQILIWNNHAKLTSTFIRPEVRPPATTIDLIVTIGISTTGNMLEMVGFVPMITFLSNHSLY